MKQERIGRKNGMTRYGTKHPDSETGSRGRERGGDINWEAERRTGEDETRGENYIEEERTPEGAKKTRESQGFKDGVRQENDIKNREERMEHGKEMPERVKREATESDTLSKEVRERIGDIRKLLRRTREAEAREDRNSVRSQKTKMPERGTANSGENFARRRKERETERKRNNIGMGY